MKLFPQSLDEISSSLLFKKYEKQTQMKTLNLTTEHCASGNVTLQIQYLGIVWPLEKAEWITGWVRNPPFEFPLLFSKPQLLLSASYMTKSM